MRITYIFRTQSRQRSIERVFTPIINKMIEDGNDVEVEYTQPFKNLLSTLLHNMWYFFKISKRRICHITGDVQYLACVMNSDNTIMTIHDVVPLRNESVPWYSKLLCYLLWYYIPLKRLKVVTCISEATRSDILSFFPWAKDKLVVIPNPIDPSYQYIPKEFNSDCPRILHVGTKPNKNLLRVIEAVKDIKCHLRIIGKIPDLEIEQLNRYNVEYSNDVYVSDEQMLQEYIDCDIVSFPSLFEGFGMPIIEGQAVGRIVLSSNIEPMKSVSNGASCLIDPNSSESIRKGFLKVINDELYRDRQILHARLNSERYSIHHIGSLYQNTYQELLDYNKLC